MLLAINLHIGEYANLTLSLIGVYLSIKDRTKPNYWKGLKISKYIPSWSLWTLFSVIIFTSFVLKINIFFILLLCSLYFYLSNYDKVKSPKKYWRLSVIVGTVHTFKVWPVLFIVGLVSAIVLEGYDVQTHVLELKKGNYTNIVYIVITACLFAPITEEIIFRGMLYTLFKRRIGVFWACVGNSVLFSLIHYNILSCVVLFVFSCSLTYIYEKESSLLIPIISHSVFNGLMIILILL